MPDLTVLTLRLALIYMIGGFTLGSILLVNEAFPISLLVWKLTKVHMELLLIGFMAELAVGVAFWILPRFTNEPPRGNEKIAWISLILLNVGIVCVVLAVVTDNDLIGVSGRILEASGGCLFLLHCWKRLYSVDTECKNQ
ncbi:MAG: cbb3-type cytochrome c oxidase subunit I [Candidatus Obscuribacterales bacterium]|nr:cbb3-type cytochrome c oxidase subunit I [Candidatus Obscuribacterales bacterium]